MYNIKQYKQKNDKYIICVSPYGLPAERACTFINAEKIDIFFQYAKEWKISLNSLNEYPSLGYLKLHREAFGKDLPRDILLDHTNLVKFDNVDDNLNPVTPLQNMQNKMSRRYLNDPKRFIVQLSVDVNKIPNEMYQQGLIDRVDRKRGYIYSREFNNEADACRVAGLMERVYKKYNPDYNIFDITHYMKDDLKTLFALRRGEISQDEADFLHLSSYRYNAWYVLRYNLEDTFKMLNIPIPKYNLDENGYMVEPTSGMRLCPSKCNTREPKWNFSTYYQALSIEEVVSSDDIDKIALDLELPDRLSTTPRESSYIDEDLLYTELYTRYSKNKEAGYSARVALYNAKSEYNNLIPSNILNKVTDKVHDSVVIVPEVSNAEKKEERKSILSFFQSFCGVCFDTDVFLAEFATVVISKEKVGYTHKAALVSSIDEYIRIFRVNKIDLFIKYYEDREKHLICRDFYQDKLNIEELWKSLTILKLTDFTYEISDNFTGEKRVVISADIPMYSML